MITTKQLLEAINAVSQRLNETNERMDEYFTKAHEQNLSKIDYLAMMQDIQLDEEKSEIAKEDIVDGAQ